MAQKNLEKGIFITFEGFEGSGKSTQIKLLAEYLIKKGYLVLVLREPGSTKISEALREVLLDKKNNNISVGTELLLYIAARAQIVQEKIIPALKDRMVVLCDRFHDATVAYQGYGLGQDLDFINRLGVYAMDGIKPDLTVIFDIDVTEGLRRIFRDKDRIEERPLDYHERVRQGYLEIAKNDPKRVKMIKVAGSDSITDIQNKVREIIKSVICNS